MLKKIVMPMERKKELGKLMKHRLESAERLPDENTWKAIRHTLDKQGRRRKRFLWFFGTLSIVGPGLFFLFSIPNPIFPNKTKSEDNTLSRPADRENQPTISRANDNPALNNPTQETEEKQLPEDLNPVKSNRQNTGLANSKDSKARAAMEREYRSGKEATSHKQHTRKSHSQGELANDKQQTIASDSLPTNQAIFERIHKDAALLAQHRDSAHMASRLIKNDSLPIKKDNTKRPLRKRLKKTTKNEEAKKDSLANIEYTIAVYGGPVFNNFFSQGHPLLEAPTTGNAATNLSFTYRILAGVSLSENVDFRLGLSVLNFNYALDDIPVALGSTNFPNLVVSNTRMLRSLPSAAVQDLSNGLPVNFDHNIKYLQIPLEASYNVWKSAIELDLIAGLDLLFLQKNEIFLQTPNSNRFVAGEADYLRPFATSIHVGTGIRYPMNSRITLDLEPTFIYQFSGFTIANPDPYYFGVFGGATFKF